MRNKFNPRLIVIPSSQTLGFSMTQTFYVDPSLATNGNGSLANPYNTWAGISFIPGDTYLQKDGTVFNHTALVTGNGTASAPITIGTYGSGAAPETNGFWFVNASYTTLSGFAVEGNTQWASVVVAVNSHNITVTGNDLSQSLAGVTIADGAGVNNLVTLNNIHNNQYFGVSVDHVNGPQDIKNNNIHNNGSDEVHLSGDGVTVEYNLIQQNGQTTPGSSGVHSYAAGATDDAGNNNIIRYNLISGTQDSGSGDGNGIQLDEWTHNNAVYGNVTNSNAGAGIVVYGSHNNQIIGNVLIGDEQGASSQHGVHAELALTSNASGPANPTNGNVVETNALDSSSSLVVDFLVDFGLDFE